MIMRLIWRTQMMNKNIDFSFVRTIRVPHEQFQAIKEKAEYVMIVDKDKGDGVVFKREKEEDLER